MYEQNLIADPSSQNTTKMKSSGKKRKNKIIILMILVGAAIGAIAYINKDPDPTTWESIRTDYKNTK